MTFGLGDILTLLTVVTLLAIVIGDRVLGWLKTRGIDLSKVNGTHDLCGAIYNNTQALIKLFDDSTLEDAIKKLSDNISIQTTLLQQMVAQTKLSHEEHKLILDQMARDRKR